MKQLLSVIVAATAVSIFASQPARAHTSDSLLITWPGPDIEKCKSAPARAKVACYAAAVAVWAAQEVAEFELMAWVLCVIEAEEPQLECLPDLLKIARSVEG